jgi:hypothetical protein
VQVQELGEAQPESDPQAASSEAPSLVAESRALASPPSPTARSSTAPSLDASGCDELSEPPHATQIRSQAQRGIPKS